MADNTIDSLALEISSNSAGAEKALDKLAGSLARLQKSMNLVSNSKLGGFNAAIKNLKDSLTGFSGVGNLEKGITQIQRLSRLNSDGLSKAAVGLTEVSDALKGMNGISIPNLDGLELFIANIRKFGGKNVGAATKNLSVIARDLVNLVSELNQVGAITFDFSGLQSLVQSISNLGLSKAVNATKNMKTLKEQLLRFISGLNGIGKLNFDVSGLNELVTALSKLGYSAALKAPTNIRELADSMRYLLSTLSQAPNVSQNVIQMANAMAQLAASGGRAGVASKALANGFNIIPASASKARKGFSGLAGAIGKFYATYWLLIRALGGFRKAIDISSDLTEVQNVVDVTFGEMSDTINNFAKSALQNYGMSELMAKQIASRFQAMGVSMGFNRKQMAEMSIELTKLTGDMASFWNVSQEGIAQKLQSIFTGETEPLRSVGLDLSFATVEAWALSEGLDADMQSMTQAEKTMLRYQYVMRNTGMVSGDFLATLHSWHNQLVLLSGGFHELGKSVGNILKNAFKPFIEALNSVMGSIIQFAETVSNALGAIFGWKYEKGGGTATEDIEYGASAADDMEDALGGAADNAKKLNKYIAGWHELNIMNTNDDSGGSGGGASGGSGISGANGGEWIRTESMWESYTSSIDSLQGLGNYIRDTLIKAMESIDWESVYEKTRGFGTGLAEFLNGLLDYDGEGRTLFGEVGKTFANTLNAIIYSAQSFATTFNFEQFGVNIADGINNFFQNFDFAALANTIDLWVQGIWTTIKTTIQETDWKKVWDGVKDFLSNIDLETVALIIGAVTIKNIGKILLSANILKILQTAIGSKMSAAIVKGLSFDGIGKLITDLFPSSLIATKIGLKMLETGKSLPAVLMSTVGASFKNFLLVTLPSIIANGFASIGTAIGLSGTAAVVGGGALIVGAIAAVVTAIVAAVTHWDEIKVFFTETIPSWWNGTAMPFFLSIPDNLLKIWENVKKSASEKWGEFLSYMQGIPNKVSEIIASIGDWFSQLPSKIGFGLGYALGTITKWALDVYEYLKNKIPEIISSVGKWFGGMKDKIGESIDKFFTETLPRWKQNVSNFFFENIPEIISNAADKFMKFKDQVGESIGKFITETLPKWKENVISFFSNKVPEIIKEVKGFFGDFKNQMMDVGENIVRGLWDGIENMVGWIGDKISGFVQGVINGFKEGFDEHSPSKVAFKIGDFWTVGLGNGMVEGFSDIYHQIDQFTSNVGKTHIPVPKLNTTVPKVDFQTNGYDVGKVKSTLQMEMDSRAAEQQWEIRQQNELLREQNELLRGIYEKPVLTDDDVFNATRRGQNRFQRRTFKTGWAGVD